MKVRIPRGSSAKMLFSYKATHATDDVNSKEKEKDGNTPVEMAVNVMQLVYDKAGKQASIPLQNLSPFDRLQNLRCEPAIDLLKTTSWRKFFGEIGPPDSKHGRNSAKKKDKKGGLGGGKPPASSSSYKSGIFEGEEVMSLEEMASIKLESSIALQKISSNLSLLFERMSSRIEMLWNDLNIAQADREFYRQSLGVVSKSENAISTSNHRSAAQSVNMDQCRELARYINALQQHRLNTVTVLKAISIRESCLKRLYDVLSALGNRSNNITSWRREFVMTLKELQLTTVDVVRNIQQWRRFLWRPHPFQWYGKNYLLKIQTDMQILEADIYIRQLQQCKLSLGDLLCVTFLGASQSPPVGSDEGDEEQKMQRGHEEGKDDTSKNTDDNDSNALEAMRLRQFFMSEGPAGDAAGQLIYPGKEELLSCANVVLGEEALMWALKKESEALLEKGVFIPTIRLLPSQNLSMNGSSVQNTSTNQNQTQSLMVGFPDGGSVGGGTDGIDLKVNSNVYAEEDFEG